MIKAIAHRLIRNAETRLGVELDYAHEIADTSLGLLGRYNRIFGFLDPVRHLPPAAYHAARIRGALAADCGTCVEAELNLAENAGLDGTLTEAILRADFDTLPVELIPVVQLADAVTKRREDDAEARAMILQTYGEAGMIELAFAMNGAALLPGIKRAMGHAGTCDLSLMRRTSAGG